MHYSVPKVYLLSTHLHAEIHIERPTVKLPRKLGDYSIYPRTPLAQTRLNNPTTKAPIRHVYLRPPWAQLQPNPPLSKGHNAHLSKNLSACQGTLEPAG